MVEKHERLALEAQILCCGYDAGYFTKGDIEQWAERLIAGLDEPPLPLIELATIRLLNPVDVMSLLRSFSSRVQPLDLVEAQIGFIGLAFDSGKRSLRDSKNGLWDIIHADCLADDQRSKFYIFDDRYDLALHGVVGTMKDVEGLFRDFVMPYAKDLQRLYPELFVRVPSSD